MGIVDGQRQRCFRCEVLAQPVERVDQAEPVVPWLRAARRGVAQPEERARVAGGACEQPFPPRGRRTRDDAVEELVPPPDPEVRLELRAASLEDERVLGP